MSKGNRVRYVDHKFKSNCKISGKSFTSEKNGATYRIVLDLEQMQYYIRNERSKEYVFKSKVYTNMNVLKRTARAELERFGVNLSTEVRGRTFGLCKKGMTQTKWKALKSIKELD
jgi:hypothetical protein